MKSSRFPEVSDICSAIESATHPRLGFRVCSSEALTGPYEVQAPPCRLSPNCVPLCDFLPAIRREEFNLRDLYTLAITLVSSTLQLFQTPWLHQPWGKESIQFLRLRDPFGDLVDIRHPYLTQSHGQTQGAVTSSRNQHKDGQTMLSLAILLLELNSGTPIEQMQQEKDLGPSGELSDWANFATAKRWLELRLENGRLTRQFADAITYCLQCYVDPRASFRNPDFLKSVEEKVLEPLESEMQYLYGRV